jgi:hypothetical protein
MSLNRLVSGHRFSDADQSKSIQSALAAKRFLHAAAKAGSS